MNDTEKWFWMLEYCEKHKLDPGESSNWGLALEAHGESYKNI